jgi:predicted SprT family Zn-dependent metalloprotease
MNPPAVYEKWWKEIMQCSHLYISNRVKHKIEFWNVAGSTFAIAQDTSDWLDGVSILWAQKIYLRHDQIGTEKLVKHEMLHMLLWNTSGLMNGHPEVFNKCKVDSPSVWKAEEEWIEFAKKLK